MRVRLRGLDERRVTLLLAAFFLALAIPGVLLVGQAYKQLELEAFRRTQQLAEQLAAQIDADLVRAVAIEEARSFGDYSFLSVAGDATANFVQRSPLAAFPVNGALPGTLGYFQVDSRGALTTPLLPAAGVDVAAYGVGQKEHAARRALEETIRGVLAANSLVVTGAARDAAALSFSAPPATPEPDDARKGAVDEIVVTGSPVARAPVPDVLPVPEALLQSARGARAELATAQAAFDRLSAAAPPAERTAGAGGAFGAARAERDELSSTPPAPLAANLVPAQVAVTPEGEQRRTRVEQSLLAEPDSATGAGDRGDADGAEVRVRTFESELDPFELGLLETGHFVLFRKVWRDGERYIQGALLDAERFVAGAIGRVFLPSSLASTAALSVAYRGEVIARLAPGADTERSLLYRARLSPPYGNLELIFAAGPLSAPTAGGTLLAWVTVALAVTLGGGFFLARRFAIGQIRLTRQQQDFVSAVSHELKTPLTSIRMYGEMLQAGWADESRKRVYYDYIRSESERLSRLIDNVLQLARLTRNTASIVPKRMTAAELLDVVRSKVASQVERAGFGLDVVNGAPPDTAVVVDPDCFTQIVINLVDNALKFATAAERKIVELGCRRESDGRVLFTVRDYGPGVPKGRMKRIFELFYRPDDAATRAVPGTGIGLALVRELATAMGGRVDVRNVDPGAEFRLSLPPAA